MRGLILVAFSALTLIMAPAFAHGPEEHGSQHETTFGMPGDPDAPSRTVEISMQEGDGRMLFVPDAVTIAAGEQVRFSLRNIGELEHEFVLGTAEEIDEHADMMLAMPDMQHNDPNAKRLQPKESGDIVWKFTAAGEYQFACLIPGHREAGMVGKISVK